MPFLDAALAFALTMLVVSTIVSQIVRVLRNTAKLRNTELQNMLAEFVEGELQPVVTRELKRLERQVSQEVTGQLSEALGKLQMSDLFKPDELARLVDVSTEEIQERLKRSSLGQELLTELGDKAQMVFDELGRRYELVGDRFTQSFRENSRLWATGVALILAVVLNIDSIFLADSYVRNQSLRQEVIAHSDAFVNDYYVALVAELEKDKGKAAVTKEDLKAAFNEGRKQLGALPGLGFPIGWSYFPHAGFQADVSDDYLHRNNLGGWLMWVFGILLTAVLAGLGAPFWYDAVSGISRVVQRARGVGKPKP